jgi:dTDP-4-dehydrorhamnose reductase
MSSLIIGDRGMLARALKNELTARGASYVGLDLPAFDLTEREHVARAIAPGTRVVFNCSAFTNVDGAESDEQGATRVNGLGVALLAEACAQAGVPLVHFSTDYVFPGNASAPYPVDELQAPLGAYGRSKALGERALWTTGGPHLLIRTSWLYAPWANNFVRTIYKASGERPELRVVHDQRGRPTSAEHLARSTLLLLDKGARGTFHVCDGGECTWFEFASEIVRLSGHACTVSPCTTAEFPRPAPRPAYSVLDLSKTEARIGAMPDWRRNLQDVCSHLEPF